MKFVIVEIKNRDTFVLYDTINKGVCCCDLSALHKLVFDYKCEVVGFDTVTHNIVACCLNGTPRKTKTQSMCDVSIKRSAALISKGLPADKFPRSVKQHRNYPLHSRVIKTDSGDIRVTEGDILEFTTSENQKFVGLVVYASFSLALTSNFVLFNNLFLFIDGSLEILYSAYKSIQPCKISDSHRTYLHNVFNIYRQVAVLDAKRVTVSSAEQQSSVKLLIAEKQAELQQLNVSYANSQIFLTDIKMKAVLNEHLKDKLWYKIEDISACLPIGELKSAPSGVFNCSFSYNRLSSVWTLSLTTSVYIHANMYDMIETPYFYESDDADDDFTVAVQSDTPLWNPVLADICGSFKTSFKYGSSFCSVGWANKGYLLNYVKQFSFKSSHLVCSEVFQAFLKTVQ